VKAHHDRPAVDGDTLREFPDIRIDHFWSKCEEVLPEGWALGLRLMPTEKGPVYQASAMLLDEVPGPQPHIRSEWKGMPERALEQLFYRLRDGLVSLPASLDEPPPGAG
jgi:hypothetical protein